MDFAKEEREIKRLCERGWQEFAANDYQAAWESFEAALLLDVETPMANSVGAACLFRLDQVERAEPLARKGVELSPQNHLAHIFLAEILFASGQNEEGESEMWEAIAIEPNDPELRFELGRALLSGDQYEKAIEHFEKSLEFKPEQAEARFFLGFCLAHLREWGRADGEFLRAIQLDPNHDRAHFAIGLLKLDEAERQPKIAAKIPVLKIASKAFYEARRINTQFHKASEYYLHCEKTINQLEEFERARSGMIIYPSVMTVLFLSQAASQLKTLDLMENFISGKELPPVNYVEALQSILVYFLIYLVLMSIWAWNDREMLKYLYQRYRLERRGRGDQETHLLEEVSNAKS
jgi:tetratricopeptide (TPR) repeat protein